MMWCARAVLTISSFISWFSLPDCTAIKSSDINLSTLARAQSEAIP